MSNFPPSDQLESLLLLLAYRRGVLAPEFNEALRGQLQQQAADILKQHQGNLVEAISSLVNSDQPTASLADFETIGPNSLPNADPLTSSPQSPGVPLPPSVLTSADSSSEPQTAWQTQPPTDAPPSDVPPSRARSVKMLPRPLEAERFVLTGELGQGGLGRVMTAEDRQLGRRVAVKQIRDDCADEPLFRAKFDLEARLTGNLEHPGIIPIYAYGQDQAGRMYYAMRVVDGRDLRDEIREFHTNQKSTASNFQSSIFRALIGRLIDVGQAVEYAHSQGVLHRDLKPNNVMVGKFGETILLDWGLAKSLSKDHSAAADAQTPRQVAIQPAAKAVGETSQMETQPGQALGTPGYASPEQLSGQSDALGPATDVYGLGAILYEMLVNRPPIELSDRETMCRQTIRGEIAPPRTVSARIPKPLAAIAMRALATQPAERYPTAAAVLGDLEHWLADEPTWAHQDSWTERGARWVRRHRAAVLASLIALMAIALITTSAAMLINRQRVAAKQLADENGQLAESNLSLANDEAAAREQAELRLEESTAVTDFLVDVLGRPDPETDGRSVKVADVLLDAFDKLADRNLTNTSKNAVLRAIASSLFGLGLYDETLPVVDAALATLADESTKQLNPLTQFDTVNLAGKCYLLSGKTTEAEKLFRRALTTAEDYRETVPLTKVNAARLNLIEVLRRAGQPIAAIEQADKALTQLSASQGEAAEGTLVARNLLAILNADNGFPEKAIPLYQRNLELLLLELDETAGIVLATKNNLASAFRKTKQFELAEPLFLEVLATRRETLGDEHMGTLGTMNNLAMLYGDMGDWQKNNELTEQVYQICKKAYGESNRQTLVVLNNLAFGAMRLNDLPRATELFERSLNLRKQSLPAEHPDVLEAENNYGFILAQNGEHELALTHYETALRGQQRVFPAGDSRTLDTLENLIETQQALGNQAAVEESQQLFDTLSKQ
ncbi:tetratricopeptide repeat protein [Planctomycetaceae bacterium SH139]